MFENCFTCYIYFTFIQGKTKLFEMLPVLIQAIIILSDKRTTLPLRLDVSFFLSLLKLFWVTGHFWSINKVLLIMY